MLCAPALLKPFSMTAAPQQTVPLESPFPLQHKNENEAVFPSALWKQLYFLNCMCAPEDTQHNLSSHTSPVIHAQPTQISGWAWHSKGVQQQGCPDNLRGSEQLLEKVHFPFTQPVPVTHKFRPGGAAQVMLDVRYDVCCKSWASQCW